MRTGICHDGIDPMVAYSFKRQFAEPILDGRKGGTIRANRRRHARPGEEVQLYTGMRTKQCRLIARKTCCEIEPVTLDFRLDRILLGYHPPRVLRGRDLDRFAQFDGFENWPQMSSFWGDVSSFFGWHIRWVPLQGCMNV
jgi:hypothetical protein